MRILDIYNNEIQSPDMELGYLVEEKLFVAHHEAVPKVEEQWHYIYGITEPDGTFVEGRKYASGGQDAQRVIDIPGQKAVEAWDEYEDILRYIQYTPEELEEIENQKQEAENNRPVTWAELAAAYEEGVLSA